MLKIINVLCIQSGWKQAVLLALNNCAPLTVLCIAQYYAVMMRGEGSWYILLGPANPTGLWDPSILNMFFSGHTSNTGTMHFFAYLSRLVYTSQNFSFISLCKTLCLWRSKSFWIWCCVDCWYRCLHIEDSYWVGWIQLLLSDSCYVPINIAPYPQKTSIFFNTAVTTSNVVYLMTTQQMHIYKYAQSHTIRQQLVSDTSMTIIGDSCNKNAINTQ